MRVSRQPGRLSGRGGRVRRLCFFSLFFFPPNVPMARRVGDRDPRPGGMVRGLSASRAKRRWGMPMITAGSRGPGRAGGWAGGRRPGSPAPSPRPAGCFDARRHARGPVPSARPGDQARLPSIDPRPRPRQPAIAAVHLGRAGRRGGQHTGHGRITSGGLEFASPAGAARCDSRREAGRASVDSPPEAASQGGPFIPKPA